VQTANWQTTHEAASRGVGRTVAAAALGITLAIALAVGLVAAGAIPAPGGASAPVVPPAPGLQFRAGEAILGDPAPKAVHGDARAIPE
jgi:hypothetical protein